MRALTLLFLISVSGYAAEKPVCDGQAVTRACKFFEERKDQAQIKLSDGSGFANPMYVSSHMMGQGGASPDQYGYGGGGLNYNSQQAEAMQINQAEIIDQMAGEAFSTRFKMAFVNSAGYLAANPEIALEMPWPPDSKKPKMLPTTGKEVFAYAKKKMTTDEYAKFMKLVDVQKEPQVKAALEMQKKQQEQMAKRQKEEAEFQAANQRIQSKKNRIRELFAYAQDQMIALISQGRKESDLTPEQKNQIAKIKSIELHNLDDPNIGMDPICMESSQENAFYSPYSHDVRVCPGYFTATDAKILLTLAHEIGHSIDACGSQMPLWNVHPENLEAFKQRKDITDVDRERIDELMPHLGKKLNFDLKIDLANPEILDKLVQSGVLKQELSGSPYKSYPQRKEVECLGEGGKIKVNFSRDVEITKAALKRMLETSPADEKAVAGKLVQRYGKALDAYPQCLNTVLTVNQAKEVSSDIFGALVLEKYLMDYPPKNEEEKVASVMMWADTACTKSGPPPNKKRGIESGTPMILSNYFASEHRLHEHPDHQTRLERVYLNLPGMANLFDCKRQEKACLDHLSFYNRSSKSQKSAIDLPKQKGVR